MGPSAHNGIDARRYAKAYFPEATVAGRPRPPGCKGAACPAFAICQGHHESRETRVHPDGGVWIESRG